MSKTGRMTVTASRREADLVSHITGAVGAAHLRRLRRLGSFPKNHPPDDFPRKTGGACRDRTDDLKLAKLALSQLS